MTEREANRSAGEAFALPDFSGLDRVIAAPRIEQPEVRLGDLARVGWRCGQAGDRRLRGAPGSPRTSRRATCALALAESLEARQGSRADWIGGRPA